MGAATLSEWIRTVLSTPAREFPDFPAALSLLDPSLKPSELRALLEARIAALETRLAGHTEPHPELPRMFLLEEEYMAALVRAEVAWLRDVVADLRSGRLRPPTMAEMRRLSTLPGAPSEDAMRAMAERAAGASLPRAKRSDRRVSRRD